MSVKEAVGAAEAVPRWRRRFKLVGPEPLLHPELPEVLARLGDAGSSVVALRTSGKPLLREAVLRLLTRSSMRWLELDLSAWVEAGAAAQGAGHWQERVAGLLRRGIPLRNGYVGTISLHALLAGGEPAKIAGALELMRPRGLIVHAWKAPSPVPGATALADALDALTRAVDPLPLHVEGLAPCTLPESSDLSGEEIAWSLRPCLEGTGGATGRSLDRVEACPRCPVRVACAGLPEGWAG